MERNVMRCEEVRRLLPEFAGEDELHPREVEVHLATCGGCAAEEARYRGVISALISTKLDTEPLPPGFADEVVLQLARPRLVLRGRVRRLAHDPRARYTAASLGGAVVGATAIAILLRRGRRSTMAAA
jgi:anti-sigma factor RsiW